MFWPKMVLKYLKPVIDMPRSYKLPNNTEKSTISMKIPRKFENRQLLSSTTWLQKFAIELLYFCYKRTTLLSCRVTNIRPSQYQLRVNCHNGLSAFINLSDN